MTLPVSAPARHLGTFSHGSEEWHAARLVGLGGSEIAAVLDLSPWESRYALYQRKRGHIPPQDLSDVMEWGVRLEEAILGKFIDQHPELSVQPHPGTYASAERRWQIANPDAVFYSRPITSGERAGIVEVKKARDAWEWGQPGTDEIPPYYLAQTRWYLDVFDLPVCWVAVLIGGDDYREYVVHPNEDDTALMRAAAEQFIEDVRSGRAPGIDSSDATYQAVKLLPAGVIEGNVELAADLADRYLAALTNAERATVEKRHVTSLILNAIGDHTRATHAGAHVATRAVNKTTGRTHALMPSHAYRPAKETTR